MSSKPDPNWITIYEDRRGKRPRKVAETWLHQIEHPQTLRELRGHLDAGRTIRIVPGYREPPSRWD